MSSALRRLRARLFTPSLREVDPEVRGFHPWRGGGESIVEPVGTAFLTGYRYAMEEKTAAATVRRIAAMPDQYAGFAMEGAGMGTAVRAAVEPWSRHQFDRFLAVAGERHVYMTYVGLGWALCRIPKPFWPNLSELDPLYAPLVLDGYAFHEVFFKTKQLGERPWEKFPWRKWPWSAEEGRQQLAQGVGRALWFVGAGDPEIVADLISALPEDEHGSAWAGLGLAISYAGGRDADLLLRAAEKAGEHAFWMRQGAAFAVEARVRAGRTVEHTRVASRALLGLEPERVSEVITQVRPAPALIDAGGANYESWRADIATALDRARTLQDA